jgi:signal transduction histidine kinase
MSPEGSLPRWERLLLAAEMGTVDADPDGDHRRARSRSARDWVVDTVLFAYAVLAAGATAISDNLHVGTTMSVVDAALAVPACLLLWTRRRHPLGVGWLTVGLSAISSAAVHAAQVAIFSAAIHARPRRAVELTVAAIAAIAVDCSIYTGAHGHGHFNTNFFAIWSVYSVAALALGSFVRVRRQLVGRLQSEQQMRIREAQLAERARIAREMHDVLAHRISLLSVHAGALEFNPDASAEEIARGLGVIRSSARAAQEELREVIGILRSDAPDDTVQPPQPTLADLAQLVDASRHAGMDVALVDQLPDQPMPALVGRTVYRVVQEALTNARKHAPGQPVSISIVGDPGAKVHIEVVNRPAVGEADRWTDKPFEHVGSGTGLIGLAERLALAGGTLEHRTLAGGGFWLNAAIAWTIPEQRRA